MLKMLKKIFKKNFFKSLYIGIDLFFQENPASFYALSFLLGILIKFEKNILFLIPVLFIKKKYLFFSIILIGYIYTSFFYPRTLFIKKPTPINGIYKTSSIRILKNYGKTIQMHRGYFKKLTIKNIKYKNIAATVFTSKKVPANHLYKIKAIAYSKTKNIIYVKPMKIQLLQKTYNLIDFRLKIKKFIKKKIYKNIKLKYAKNFLSAIFIGQINDKLLKFSFNQKGLAHILAISGFHFSLIIILFSYVAKYFISISKIPIFLIILSFIYFLYIGNSPSVIRAFFTIQLSLLASLLNKKNYPINTLSIVLLLLLIINPIYVKDIAFFLSFLSVFSILLTYPIIKSLSNNKVTSYLKTFTKEAFFLYLSVNITLLPAILFLFKKFPISSIFFNIFFPAFLLASIPIYLISLAVSFICLPLGSFLHNANSLFLNSLIKIIIFFPKDLEFFIRTRIFSKNILFLYLMVYFLVIIFLRNQKNNDKIPKPFDFL